jgi:hypothetical protein
LFDGFFHLVFYFFDFLISFVDGDGFDFFREWQFFDAIFYVFETDLSLTL